MDKVKGKNIYEYPDLPYEQKEQILESLVGALKDLHSYETGPVEQASVDDAYVLKTYDRLEKVRELVPFAKDETIVVNGKACRNPFSLQAQVEDAVAAMNIDQFCLLHGDCTFSNLMLDEQMNPVLIDPRGYFGHTELLGDPNYDWAKLYYSLVGNYDQFNLKRFKLSIGENSVQLDIDSNRWEELEPVFFRLLEGEIDPDEIKLLHALIWLSLTTYAWQDYDSICGAFYNGVRYLEEALGVSTL